MDRGMVNIRDEGWKEVKVGVVTPQQQTETHTDGVVLYGGIGKC